MHRFRDDTRDRRAPTRQHTACREKWRMKFMEITVNGETRQVEGPLTVEGLLQSLGITAGSVAVEQNLAIVNREAYSQTPVQAGDVIEIIRFVGGG